MSTIKNNATETVKSAFVDYYGHNAGKKGEGPLTTETITSAFMDYYGHGPLHLQERKEKDLGRQ